MMKRTGILVWLLSFSCAASLFAQLTPRRITVSVRLDSSRTNAVCTNYNIVGKAQLIYRPQGAFIALPENSITFNSGPPVGCPGPGKVRINRVIIPPTTLDFIPTQVNLTITENGTQTKLWQNLLVDFATIPSGARFQPTPFPQKAQVSTFYTPENPRGLGDPLFINPEGYMFSIILDIPQIEEYDTYRDAARTSPSLAFCAGDHIYLDTYYKRDPTVALQNFIEWEYWYSDDPSVKFRSSEFLNNGLDVTTRGRLADPTDSVSIKFRVRLKGQFSDPSINPVAPSFNDVPYRGPWSVTRKITIYPQPPQINMTGINPSIPLTDASGKTETTTDGSFAIHHVTCHGGTNGEIVINRLATVNKYLLTLTKQGEAPVNHTINFRPSPSTPYKIQSLTPGNYELKIQIFDPQTNLPFACFSTQNFTIKQPGAVLQRNVSKPKYHSFDLSCNQSSDGRISVKPQGGITPYEITLKGFAGANPTPVVIQDEPELINGAYLFKNLQRLSGGVLIDYKVTVVDGGECTLPDAGPFQMEAPPPIVISYSDNPDLSDHHNHNIRCFGSTDDIDVSVSGGTSRFAIWLDDIAIANDVIQRIDSIEATGQPVFSNLPAAQYMIHAVDRNGCVATQTFNFTQPQKLTVEESEVTSVACFGKATGAIQINGLGGVPLPGGQRYRYTLLNSNPLSVKKGEEVLFTDLISGTYTITISDTLGCEQPYQFTITQPPALSLTVDPNEIICYGDASGTAEATVVGGGIAPYTLQWLNGEKEVITSEPLSNPGDKSTIDSQSAGPYYAKLIDASGCVLESPFNFSQPPEALSMNVNSGDTRPISCHDANDGQITLSVTGGWTLSPYEIGRSKNNLQPGAFLYTALAPGVHRFYARDSKGCLDSLDVPMTEPEILEATGTEIIPVSCHGDSNGSFSQIITGGTAPYELNTDGSGWIPAGVVSGLAEGDYLITVRDDRGCVLDFSVTIPTPDELSADLVSSTDTRCGESNGEATISISGGTTPYSIEWSLHDQPVPGEFTATGLFSGLYEVMITDEKNCQASMNIGISDSDAAVITIESVTPVTCFGDADGTASVSATGGVLPYAEITWTNGQTGLQATGLTASSHFISIKDREACVSIKEVIVPGPDEIQASFVDVVFPKCFGDEDGRLRVEASGGIAPYTYLWTNTSNSTDHIEGAGAGIYSVMITDSNGCVMDATYDLAQPALVEVDLDGEEVYCTGQTVKLDAGNPGSTYQWTSTIGVSSTEQIFEATETGIYSVTVTNPQGCTGSGSRDLTFGSDILRADFISSSEAMAGDTVVLINVTFPLPDSAYWTFPEGVQIIESTYFAHYVVFPDSGVYAITLSATKGECFDLISDNITISERKDEGDGDDPGGRKASLITSFNVHPNPSSGRFRISLQLREAAAVEIGIYSVNGGNAWVSYKDTDSDNYEIDAEMNAPAGVYSILLKAGNEIKIKRIIIR